MASLARIAYSAEMGCQGYLRYHVGMEFCMLLLISALAILALVTILWLVSLWLKDASIIDIFWGPGFVLVAWLLFWLAPEGDMARRWLLATLVSVWGLRLAWHIGRRNIGHGEDFRYSQWRQENGGQWWWRSYFKVFLLQGLLMWVIALPVTAVMANSSALGWLDLFGILIWAIGFLFEAIGDWQLTRFKANPANRGQLMTRGLWSLTRHPNYFGDAVQWWGFYLFALAAGAWWTIFSPVVMTLLLRYVSGVAMLERSMSKKPGFAEYARRTPAFIPWFPKSS